MFWEPVRLFFLYLSGELPTLNHQPSTLNPKLSTINPLSHHRLNSSFLSTTVHVEEEDTRLELEAF